MSQSKANGNERPRAIPSLEKCRCLLVIGTRPEAIKMAPVVQECRRRADEIETMVCFTGQHREMLHQVAEYFGIEPDIDLDLMRPDQSLTALTSRCLEGIDAAIDRCQPDYVVAQGDTTTVMAASIAAFYRHVPLIHVEAGLRTGDLHAPWPEEFNRRIPGITAAIHCAPTQRAADNLRREGIPSERIAVTGNTVIDALLWTVERERRHHDRWRDKYAMLGERRMVLITGHRRENFGDRFESLCRAIATLSKTFPETAFLFPVHLNPKVREPVYRLLGGKANVHLLAPASYPEFVWLMDRSTLILTDSGGVQEEAPSLGKPVLVTRETTERPEALESGAVELVGTDEFTIVRTAGLLLTDPAEYRRRHLAENPYGDGFAARRIVALMKPRSQEKAAAA
jgi:UDP-N-acetylglucosamine 2-epimerase (non-hydrolysing)